MPTRIASHWARSRWTRALASGPEMAVRWPCPAAILPSAEIAIFRITCGRFFRIRVRKPAMSRRASSAPRPLSKAIPARCENGMAAAGDAGVRVLDRRHHAGDAGPHQRLGAGAGLAMMRAGFERHIGGGAARRRRPPWRAPAFRHAACRRVASSRRPATRLVLDDHAADIGVLGGGAQRPAAEPQRIVHPAGVSCHRSRRCRPRPRVRPKALRNPWLRGNSCRPRRSAHRPRRRAS